jgi:hypothetical protein
MQNRQIGERSILPVHQSPLVITLANCIFCRKGIAGTTHAQGIVRDGNDLYPCRSLR